MGGALGTGHGRMLEEQAKLMDARRARARAETQQILAAQERTLQLQQQLEARHFSACETALIMASF